MKNRGYTILYAEDDIDDQQFFINAVLEHNPQHRVCLKNNGDDLLDTLKNENVDAHLIFLDINMPRKNGFEIMAELNSAGNTKSIPVIFLSTSDDHDSIFEAQRLGAAFYLVKSTCFRKFNSLLNYVLSIDWHNTFPSFSAHK